MQLNWTLSARLFELHHILINGKERSRGRTYHRMRLVCTGDTEMCVCVLMNGVVSWGDMGHGMGSGHVHVKRGVTTATVLHRSICITV